MFELEPTGVLHYSQVKINVFYKLCNSSIIHFSRYYIFFYILYKVFKTVITHLVYLGSRQPLQF